MLSRRRLWLYGSLLVLLVTQLVYLQTMHIQVPFWDSGEFIATSYILGIPHPPGTPLYVLIGRLFTLLPMFPEIATRVNWLSALSSSLAAVFMFLLVVELHRLWREATSPTTSEEDKRRSASLPDWIGAFAGLVAAFFTAFSRTFWDNAIEAEVYALSSLIMPLAVWMALKWARTEGDHGKRNGWFILLYYLLCLSMGIHLGTFLVLPGILLFMLVWDRRTFAEGWIGALTVAGVVVMLHPGMLPTLGLPVWGSLVGLVVLGMCLRALFRAELQSWTLVGRRGLLTWCVLAALVALSTHFYLMIRAHHNPAINEADPESWSSLWKTLTRDQYKPANPFHTRNAPFVVQLTRHFWDYARDQYALGIRPAVFGWLLPYLLGGAGALAHFRREKKTFAMVASILLITSLGMVFYLNFKADEVRPRDYFFVAAFQFFTLWIGLGAAWLLEWAVGGVKGLAEELEKRERLLPPVPVLVAGVALVLLPGMTARHYWHEHDRTDFHVARDFAWNLLTPLKPNALLFTNGDNDTFPLWYLQYVERVRTDVRVVNLSLLNTAWYMRQLRDEPPKVNLGWSDDEILAVEDFSGWMQGYLRGYVSRPQLEEFLTVTKLRPYVRSFEASLLAKDVTASRIIEREYGQRPIYMAMTVPDRMGLEPRLDLTCLAYEIGVDHGGSEETSEPDEVWRNLNSVFRYTQLMENGRRLDRVHYDENALRLMQNYAAAALAAAHTYRRSDRLEEAERVTRWALELCPQVPEVHYGLAVVLLSAGRGDEAEQEVQWIIHAGEGDAQIYRLLGRIQEIQGKLDEAGEAYRRALEMAPGAQEILRDLFTFYWYALGDRARAISVLDTWIAAHPNDRRMKEWRERFGDSLRTPMMNP